LTRFQNLQKMLLKKCMSLPRSLILLSHLLGNYIYLLVLSVTLSVRYVNHLYFYPKSVNFTNYKSDKGCSARNICCEVKLLPDDANVNATGLAALYPYFWSVWPLSLIWQIYGTSVSGPLRTVATTNVVYHSKKPKWMDEIKIRLPASITPQHHILVTFYHVSCKPPKKAKQHEGVMVL